MAKPQQTFEQRAEESSDVMPEDWEPSAEDRGDGGLDGAFVPRETPDPEASAQPEVTEDELAAELETTPEATPEEEPKAEEPAEEEPATETEGEDDPEPEAKKAHSVPQARLNKEIDRRKAIEAENVRLREAVEQATPEPNQAAEEIQTKMRELVAAKNEAILNGETEKAAEHEMAVLGLQRQLTEQTVAAVQANATQATKAEMAFDTKVKELQTEYPVFDPESETFDQDLLNDVLRDRDAFYNAGTPLADALARAVKISAAINGLDAKETADEPPQATEKDTKALAKKVAAAKQQPPTLRGERTDTHGATKIEVEDLSEEDFEALPEATIRRLRGD